MQIKKGENDKIKIQKMYVLKADGRKEKFAFKFFYNLYIPYHLQSDLFYATSNLIIF